MSLTEDPVPEMVRELGIDGDDLRRRREFLELSEDDVSWLQTIHRELSHLQPVLVDDFVRHLSSFEQTRRHLPSDPSALDRFKKILVSYFDRLFFGPYDLDYARNRLRVGAIHEEMGTPPQWYLGAYVHYLSGVLPEILKLYREHPEVLTDAVRSLLKAVFFDLGLTLDAYIFANSRSTRLLKEYDEKILENLPTGLLLLSSPSLTVLSVNRTFLKQFGQAEDAVLGLPLDSVVRAEGLREGIRELLSKEDGRHALLLSMSRADSGIVHPVRVTLALIRPTETDSRILLLVSDLSEENSLRAQADGVARRFVNLAETALSGIVLVDSTGKIVYFNASSEKMFGLRRDRVIGSPVGSVLPGLPERDLGVPDPSAGHSEPIREGTGRRADGTEFPIEISLSRFEDESGAFTTLVIRDISERKQFEERILQIANFDALTGLPNRTHLVSRLDEILGRGPRTGTLLFLDLDRFKGINDSLGHDCGDALLVLVGKRLAGSVRKNEDLVARSGGDEFILLLEGVGDKKEAERIAEKILDELARPFEVDRSPVFVTASIGIVAWPEDGTTADMLLRRADTAMYRAKEIGNSCAVYASEDGVRANRKFETERELRRALERGEFELYYQPQVDLATKRTVGAEALIRWNHPEKGLLHPDDFIPVAENTGLILAIGDWVVRAACEQLRAWREGGFPSIPLTVNVSGRQFERGNLTGTFRTALEETGVEGRFLEVEITESVLMKRAMTPDELRELAKMGIRTSIDDFGTGYSSLSYLTRLPIYKLKIDRSFVTPLPTDPNVRAIATAIITMASALGLRTIAEGAETREQFEILKNLGCHEIQGYYFSPPLPESKFMDWVRERNGSSF